MKTIGSSKTVWLNVITTIIAILGFIPQFVSGIGISQHTADVITKVTLLVAGTLNIILRVFFTNQPIGDPVK